MEVLDYILPIVYIVVGCALIWFVIELVMTVRKARNTVKQVQKQLEPTLDHVQEITKQIAPVSSKIDPLVDRVSLTVDAANLEIMRADEILQNVTSITGSIEKATDVVGMVTNAPIDLFTSVTNKVRNAFKPKYASEESVKLGEAKDDTPAEKNPIRDFVDATVEAAGDAIDERKEQRRVRKEERIAKEQATEERLSQLSDSAENMRDALIDSINKDSAAGPVVGAVSVAAEAASGEPMPAVSPASDSGVASATSVEVPKPTDAAQA